ncbi:clavesin-2-like isoform X2 [Haematobia irritans]|uniref:clavesin-2-like isoform X2 n=1 Tax=Haematobia irritans TaxID=7368 RepID=UPI003F5016FB
MFTTKTSIPEAKIGDYILKFELETVSPSTLELAQKEIRETRENIEYGLQELRRLLKEERNLKTPWENDLWLLGFLRICNFYPDKAFERIKTYYTYKKRYEDVFKIAIPSRVKHVFEKSTVLPLPKRDKCDRRILIVQSGKRWDHKQIHKDELFIAGAITHELFAMEKASQITGLISIVDVEGLTLEQGLKLTMKYSRRNVESYQEGASFRVEALHFINEPSLFESVFKLARPFIRKEMSKRVHFHGSNMESLHKFVSPDCLPECYGGTMKLDLNYGPQYYEFMKNFEDDFVKNLDYGYI